MALSGISTGGDDDQTVAVTAVSDNPAVLPTGGISISPVTNGSATLSFATTGAPGTAVVTVTVKDYTGVVEESSVSQQFTVRVQQPALSHGFEGDAELAEYGMASGTAVTATRGAAVGQGNPATGGISVAKTGGNHGYHNGWRIQPYDLVEKSLIKTSILVNMASLGVTSNSGGVYLGFVNNSADPYGAPSGGTSSFLTSSTTSYSAISAYLGYSNGSSGTLSVQLHNKVTGTTTSATVGTAGSVTSATASLKNNWLRLTLTLTPTGTVNQYGASATVENLGLDGTATPAPLISTSGSATNEGIYTTSQAYAAYNVYFRDSSSATGTIKLDDHLASVAVIPPNAPTALDATAVTTTNFTANWAPATTGPSASSGYVVEVVPSGVSFETGPFIQANGSSGPAGVQVESLGTHFQVFTGLVRGADYDYRVRSVNPTGSSPDSGVIRVTVSAANIPPTLDELPAQLVLHTGDTMTRTFGLTGITNGGDVGQEITVTAEVLAGRAGVLSISSPVVYTNGEPTGIVAYKPSGLAGSDTIRVTVNDGEGTFSREITVVVNDVPENLSFDVAGDYTQYATAVTKASIAHGGAYGRAASAEDTTATGGLRIDVATDKPAYVSGWRSQAYNLSDKTHIKTSILIKPSGWGRDDEDEQFYLGFAHLASGTPPNSALMSGAAAGVSAYLSCNWKDSSDDNLYFGIANKAANGNAIVTQKADLTGRKAYKSNWHRVTLILSPLSSSQMLATATLEDLGANGTSEAVLLSTRQDTVSNAALVSSSRAYATFTSYSDDKDSGYIYLDDHQVQLARDMPEAPVALAATAITTTNITARWEPAATGPSAVGGYVFEMVPQGGNLDVGPYVQLNGTTGTVEAPGAPILVAPNAGTSLVFSGLTRGGVYQYRVRARNLTGESANSEVITVQVSQENVPPTLDPVVVVPSIHPGDTTERTVTLTGITHGGDVGQTLVVSATSSDPAVAGISQQPVVSSNPSVYTLKVLPTGEGGIATITVTVNDGEGTTSQTFTIRVQSPPSFAFDTEEEFGEFGHEASASSISAAWDSAVGVGAPPGGGVIISKSAAVTSTLAGWRKQPFNLVEKTFVGTSIMINPSEWNGSNAANATVRAGFVTGALPTGVAFFNTGTSYRSFYAQLIHNATTTNQFTLQLFNKASTTASTSVGTVRPVANASVLKANWLRLSVDIIPSSVGSSEFTATVRLENLGPDGVSPPEILAEFKETLTSASLAAATTAYAAYDVATHSGNTGRTYVDNQEAAATARVPAIPVAIDPALLVKHAFTACWDRPVNSAVDAYILEVSLAEDGLAAGSLIDAGGTGGNADGIEVEPSPPSLRVTGLLPSTNYIYRVKAVNSLGESGYSEVIAVTTPAADFNLPPTLNAIAFPLSRVSPGAAALTLNLSGITDGGEGGQPLTVTVESDNPDVADAVITTYSSPAPTAQLQVTPGLFTGIATITVRVNDGHTSNADFTQQFLVNVAPPPVNFGFDTAADVGAELTLYGHTTNVGYSSTGGAGSPPNGALVFNDTGSDDRVVNGWRKEVYEGKDALVMRTSIMANFAEISKEEVQIAVGFIHSTSPPLTDEKDWLKKKGAGQYVSAYLQYKAKDLEYEVLIGNKPTTSDGEERQKLETKTTKLNWVRLSLELVPVTIGGNVFNATLKLEDMGTDGTSEPRLLTTRTDTLTNAALATSTSTYAGLNLMSKKTSQSFYVDNHVAEVIHPEGVPDQVVANAPTLVTSRAFTANWNRILDTLVTGYRLEVSTDENFGENTFVGADGSTGNPTGINLAANATSQRLVNLPFDTPFWYRVNAYNSFGDGAYSSPAVAVRTLTETGNSPPTLTQPVFAYTRISPGAGPFNVPLAGISDGGEGNQALNVTVTSADPSIAYATVTYTPNQATGQLQIFGGTQVGDTTITVTVSDGHANNGSFSRVIPVHVGQVLPTVGFEAAGDLNSEVLLYSSANRVSHSATGGVGGSGAMVINDAGSEDDVVNGWKQEVYRARGAIALRTSIMANFAEITTEEAQIGIGFVHSSTPPGTTEKDWLKKKGAGQYVSAHLKYKRKDDKYEVLIGDKPGTGEGDERQKLETNTTPLNWVRLSLELILVTPGGNQYNATLKLEDMGVDGTTPAADPLTTRSFVVTNAALAASSSTYAGFNIRSKKTNQNLYIDNHFVELQYGPPVVPTAVAASQVTTQSFQANWTLPTEAFATGFRLEVSADESFETLLDATGQPQNAEFDGIFIPGGSVRSLRIVGLAASSSYHYRVRSFNDDELISDASNVESVTLLNVGQNAAPTLAAITFPLSRISTNSAPVFVNLTGITDGGEGGQVLTVTAVSENPDIASVVVNSYTSPATTGQIRVTGGTQTGVVPITVTVSDGQLDNPVFSRTFNVNVAPAPEMAGLDTLEDFQAEFSTAASVAARTAVWGATSGKDGTGGLSIYYHKDDEVTRYVSGWRKETYAIAGANRMTTSILIKPDGWDEKDYREAFHLGFAHNEPDVENSSSLMASGTAAALGARLAYNDDSSPYMYLALTNKAATSSPSVVGTVGIPGGGNLRSSWLRLKLVYLPSQTPNAFDVTATLENLGTTGTAEPVQVGVVRQTLTNATVFNSTNSYAAFTHHLNSSAEVTGTTYLDDHQVEVEHGPPDVPTATVPEQVTASSFNAQWTMPPEVYATGFLLEVSPSADFATLLDETGAVTAEPIVIDSGLARSQRLAGLQPSRAYYYRVSSRNMFYISAPSNVQQATLFHAGYNAPPTLDAIPAQPAYVLHNAGTHTVVLTGISGGGEDEDVSVTVTSSNAAVVPTPLWTVAAPVAESGLNSSVIQGLRAQAGGTATATLAYAPTPTITGITTITVTVSDGTTQVQRTFDIKVAEEIVGAAAGNATTGAAATGSLWKYHATGAEPAGDWKATAYEDTSWPEGPATLGFSRSNAGIATVIPAGSPTLYTTSYFRRHIPITNVADVLGVTMRLRLDDGAIIYINGLEVFRSTNMPAGPVSYSTLTTSDGDGGAAWRTVAIDPAYLLTGDNVISAEVHQTSTTSSDLIFDLELKVDQYPTGVVAQPNLVTTLAATHVTSSSFIAHWGDPTYNSPAFYLDVSTDSSFTTKDTVSVAGGSTRNYHYSGLLPGTTYFYRVRALNDFTDSTPPNSVAVTTLASGQNAPPTIDPVADVQVAVGSGEYVVDLTGISDGGEFSQLVSQVAATSNNPGLFASFGINPAWQPENYLDTATLKFTPAAGQSGEAIVTVTVRDSGGNSNTTTMTFKIMVGTPVVTQATWTQNSFPGVTDPAIIGPMADPDHDGVPNLLEYAFNTNPATPGAGQGWDKPDVSTPKPRFSYKRRIGAPGLVYGVQWSDDLSSWNESAVTEISATPISAEPGMELVTVESNTTQAVQPRQFFRVVVLTPP